MYIVLYYFQSTQIKTLVLLLINKVENCEKRRDSKLLKDIVLALPDDTELTL